MYWAIKLKRLNPNLRNTESDYSILEYFVRREVSKKLAEENTIDSIHTHFKIMKQKKCLPNPIGKAMDEWTKEDVAKMEQEAEEEIEANFPSYFNEFQRELYQANTPDAKINHELARNL